MTLEANKLRDLLSDEAEKERRAYKRATLPIAITALVGLIWLGFSAYEVVKLKRDSSKLNAEIEQQKKDLNLVQEDIEAAKGELRFTIKQLEEASKRLDESNNDLSKAKKTLHAIAEGTETPRVKAERVLENISKPPDTSSEITAPFLMAIEDIFTIQGRGVVVTGRVARGKVKVNDPVEIVGILSTRQTVVTGVEMFKKLLDEAVPGDNVGLLLRGVERSAIRRGQVIAKPGSIWAQTKFKATVDMFEKEKGRSTPFFPGYRPQFYFRTTDVTGTVKLREGVEMVMPGDKNVEIEVELIEPIALEKGLRFAIREGGKTVGAGTITSIIK